MVVVPVAIAIDMKPNLAGRDSFFSVFRSIRRFCGQLREHRACGHVLAVELALLGASCHPPRLSIIRIENASGAAISRRSRISQNKLPQKKLRQKETAQRNQG
jgi:hypothetical protein